MWSIYNEKSNRNGYLLLSSAMVMSKKQRVRSCLSLDISIELKWITSEAKNQRQNGLCQRNSESLSGAHATRSSQQTGEERTLWREHTALFMFRCHLANSNCLFEYYSNRVAYHSEYSPICAFPSSLCLKT